MLCSAVCRLLRQKGKKELELLHRQLATGKKQLEEETLLRVDLENRVQSLNEELAFSGQVHAQVSTGVIWRTAFRASTKSSPSADRCTGVIWRTAFRASTKSSPSADRCTHRCDLENRVQSVNEELAFSGQVHAQVSTGVI